ARLVPTVAESLFTSLALIGWFLLPQHPFIRRTFKQRSGRILRKYRRQRTPLQRKTTSLINSNRPPPTHQTGRSPHRGSNRRQSPFISPAQAGSTIWQDVVI